MRLRDFLVAFVPLSLVMAIVAAVALGVLNAAAQGARHVQEDALVVAARDMIEAELGQAVSRFAELPSDASDEALRKIVAEMFDRRGWSGSVALIPDEAPRRAISGLSRAVPHALLRTVHLKVAFGSGLLEAAITTPGTIAAEQILATSSSTLFTWHSFAGLHVMPGREVLPTEIRRHLGTVIETAEDGRLDVAGYTLAVASIRAPDGSVLCRLGLMAPAGGYFLPLSTMPVSLGLTMAFLLAVAAAWSMRIARRAADRRSLVGKLVESERRFRDYTDIGSDWYWEVDRNFIITAISGRFREHMGIGEEEIVGRHYQDLFGEYLTDRAQKQESVWRNLAADLAAHRPFRNLMLEWWRPDGEIRNFVVHGRPIFRGRVFVGFRGTVSDISELSRILEALDSAREMAEQANRSKSRFLAGVSHDLRQPLQAMTLFCDLLVREPQTPEARRLTYRIQDAGETLGEMLSNLTDIARIEDGRIEPEITAIPLEPYLQRLVDELTPLAEQKGLCLRLVCPRHVFGRSDPVLLGRILRNLIGNAIRYTKGGTVLVTVRGRQEGELIQIWDTGAGIPEDELDIIFDDYQRGAGQGQDGSGLGLSVVRRFARLLRHPVAVRSRLGSGSVFSVTIPKGLPGAALPSVGAAPLPALVGHVLVVDDDASILESLGGILKTAGLEPLSCGTASEALATVARRDAPPLVAIVCDYRLSDDVRGTELITALRHAVGRAVPAVLITGNASEGPELPAGVVLLRKPARADVLLNALALVGGSGVGGPKVA